MNIYSSNLAFRLIHFSIFILLLNGCSDTNHLTELDEYEPQNKIIKYFACAANFMALGKEGAGTKLMIAATSIHLQNPGTNIEKNLIEDEIEMARATLKIVLPTGEEPTKRDIALYYIGAGDCLSKLTIATLLPHDLPQKNK
jgi:hypothetical protein